MIDYTSQYQTKIEEFSSINHIKLNPNNRWIALGNLLPWDELVNIYKKKFSSNMGAKSINPRHIIGAGAVKLTATDTLSLGPRVNWVCEKLSKAVWLPEASI